MRHILSLGLCADKRCQKVMTQQQSGSLAHQLALLSVWVVG